MDEANIVSALQADLQKYKVKPQIRRKESQLHVLITRSERDNLDYDSLYDIVKRRIDKMVIEGVNSFILYGRLAGAKHPEWQKTGDIKPHLPLIELDLDELEDMGELGQLTFPTESDATEIQIENFDANSETFDVFRESLENDLRRSSLQSGFNDIKDEKKGEKKGRKSDNPNHKVNDLHAVGLDLGDFKLDNLNPDPFELDSLQSNHLEPSTFELGNELGNQSSDHRSPVDTNDWVEDDLGLDDVTLAMPMPLPPPPLPPTKRIPSKAGDENDLQPEPSPKDAPIQSSLLLSIVFAVVAIATLGICGWLVWDRSVQQKYVSDARELNSSFPSSKTVTNLDSLAETRNRLQSAIDQLEDIPDRPASLYEDAQAELTTLRPKLKEFDRKINLEQGANKNLEAAKNGTIEAAKLVQNPPHKSTVWKSAQEKRQKSIKLLQEVPQDSLLYDDAQKYLKTYRTDLTQINKRVEIQQKAESVVNSVNPNIVSQLKQLKAKVPEKQKFLPQCKAILQPQISNADGQRLGLTAVTLTEYLCAYFWDS